MKQRRAMRRGVLFAFMCLAGTAATAAVVSGVSEQRLMSHVRFLASDELEGREMGERGDAIAEKYIEAQFQQAGLTPAPGCDRFRQRFTALRAELNMESSTLVVDAGSRRMIFHAGREIFSSWTGFDDMTLRAPAVFAGFGITAPEYGYDDYKGLNVEGKIVVVFNHEPGEKKSGEMFRGRRPTRYSLPRTKAAIAAEQGALGLIIINDAANHAQDIDAALIKRRGSLTPEPYYGLPGRDTRIPVFYAAAPVVSALFDGSGVDPSALQRKIDEQMKPVHAKIPLRTVELNVRLKTVRRFTAANIVGIREGSDPALRDEYIVIGAHHDHIGRDSQGRIINGADDNASGSAGLLEAARVLQTAGLGRSVLFVSFCGEEKGTLGSIWFLDHLPVDGIRCVINLDMIGRNNMDREENANMFIVYTSAQTPALERLVRSQADAQKVDARVAPYVTFFGSSDHNVFHLAGIPVVFYFSGFSRDYNTLNDTADRIVPGKITIITRHLCSLVTRLSNIEGNELRFDRTITTEPPKDKYDLPY